MHDLTDVARQKIAAEWWFRHHAELEAMVRFERLVHALTDLGAAEPVPTMARDAVDDERRHAERCREVAQRYDATDPFAHVQHNASEVAPPEWPRADRVLYETIAMCCVAETINAALLTEVLDVATEPTVRAAVRDILRDEVQHARLGWTTLALQPSEAFPTTLGDRLPAMLQDSISEALIAGSSPSADFVCHPHGFLDQQHRIRIFAQSLDRVILPGLDRYPVDTTLARGWLEAQPWAGV